MISKDKIFDIEKKSIFIAGHNGMVGTATLNEFKSKSNQLLYVDRNKLDLKNEEKFYNGSKIIILK